MLVRIVYLEQGSALRISVFEVFVVVQVVEILTECCGVGCRDSSPTILWTIRKTKRVFFPVDDENDVHCSSQLCKGHMRRELVSWRRK